MNHQNQSACGAVEESQRPTPANQQPAKSRKPATKTTARVKKQSGLMDCGIAGSSVEGRAPGTQSTRPLEVEPGGSVALGKAHSDGRGRTAPGIAPPTAG